MNFEAEDHLSWGIGHLVVLPSQSPPIIVVLCPVDYAFSAEDNTS